MPSSRQTGNRGEDLAAEYLLSQGYEILMRNYRHRRTEIDLIARKDNFMVFVEVKTRTSSAFGFPESFVDSRKAAFIQQAAEAFIFENNWHGHVRFDVISVNLDDHTDIRHFEDAIS